MKLVVASDIHGSSYYCNLLKERFLEEKAEKLLLLGDLLYHGARNPLPKDYSTLDVAQTLNSLKDKILCVRGNCDSEVDQMVLDFPILAEFCLVDLGNVRAIATHGHKEIACLQGDILLNGHFHVPAFDKRENDIYVNCGSVSIPKENSPHSYLVIENGIFTWKDVRTGNPFRQEKL